MTHPDDKAQWLHALEEDPDDVALHLVYADWLEERGEPEEAERQRRFPEARAWLEQLVEESTPATYQDEDGTEYPNDEWAVSYEELIQMGRDAAADGSWVFSLGNNQSLADALNGNHAKFWECWSAVTGLAGPPEDEGWFRCAC